MKEVDAPSDTLRDGAGNMVRLSHFLGRKVIVYFYPKDNTPGCTQEACDFTLARLLDEVRADAATRQVEAHRDVAGGCDSRC